MNNISRHTYLINQTFLLPFKDKVMTPITLKAISLISLIAMSIFTACFVVKHCFPTFFAILPQPFTNSFDDDDSSKILTPITDSVISPNISLDLNSIKTYYLKCINNLKLFDQFQINDNMQCVRKLNQIDTLPRLIEGIRRISFNKNSTDFLYTFDQRVGIMQAFSLATMAVLKRLNSGDAEAGKLLEELKNIELPHSTPQEVIDLLDRFIKFKFNNKETILSLNKKIFEWSQDPLEKQQQMDRKEALKKSGIKLVLHTTKTSNLINLLKMQKIVPSAPLFIPNTVSGFGAIQIHGNKDIFTSILPKLTSEEQKNANESLFEYMFDLKRFENRVVLVFRKRMLINCDFHYALHQNFGKKSPGSFLEAKEIDQLLSRFGKGKGINLLRNHELVIHHSIDLKELKEIWVHSEEKKKELISLFKNNKIKFENDPAYSCIKPMINFPESLISSDTN